MVKCRRIAGGLLRVPRRFMRNRRVKRFSDDTKMDVQFFYTMSRPISIVKRVRATVTIIPIAAGAPTKTP